jgi:hypothetical protein
MEALGKTFNTDGMEMSKRNSGGRVPIMCLERQRDIQMKAAE